MSICQDASNYEFDEPMGDKTPPTLDASTRKFMRWGRSNAQLLAVGFVFVGGVWYVASRVRELQADRELLPSQLK